MGEINLWAKQEGHQHLDIGWHCLLRALPDFSRRILGQTGMIYYSDNHLLPHLHRQQWKVSIYFV